MKAVILAGGKGTRLYPYTTVFPKPLVPVDDMPIIEIMIRQLKERGVNSVTVSVGHLAELIIAFLGKGEKFGIPIEYVSEDKPMGTVAPLTLIGDLPEDFLLMNGDVLTNLNYRDLFEFHVANKSALTIATYLKKVEIDLGVLIADGRGLLTDYIEKPAHEFKVSMGIYVFNKSVIQHIPKNVYYDFPTLVKALLERGIKVMSYPFNDIWLDIGRPADYDEAQKIFRSVRDKLLPAEKCR
jgi:NDP-sugar pyrophosphorylase family protein